MRQTFVKKRCLCVAENWNLVQYSPFPNEQPQKPYRSPSFKVLPFPVFATILEAALSGIMWKSVVIE
jgi:hypothetical protein